MKTATIVGIALVVLGIVAFAFQGITYTMREKVVDLGPIQVTAEKTHNIPLTPIADGLAQCEVRRRAGIGGSAVQSHTAQQHSASTSGPRRDCTQLSADGRIKDILMSTLNGIRIATTSEYVKRH